MSKTKPSVSILSAEEWARQFRDANNRQLDLVKDIESLEHQLYLTQIECHRWRAWYKSSNEAYEDVMRQLLKEEGA